MPVADQVDGATYVVPRQAPAVLVFTMAEWELRARH